MNLKFVLSLATLLGLAAVAFAQAQLTQTEATTTAVTKKTIQAAQERLLALGYPIGAPDGVMGAKAMAALKKFQVDHHLPVTGQLDRKTLDVLEVSTPAGTSPAVLTRSFSAEAVRKAAAQGSAPAEYRLGLMCDQGWGERLDHGEAVRWWRKAAEQGYMPAEAKLGQVYASSEFVPVDFAEAANWLRKAAEQGDSASQNALGSLYLDGRGVAKDAAEARKWFQSAAEQGDRNGQTNLGLLYLKGTGVAQDTQEAARWFRKSAEQGELTGQLGLIKVLSTEKPATQDYSELYQWLSIAYQNGGAEAQKAVESLRDSVATHLTPAQMEEAQQQAREWKPSADANIAKAVEGVRKNAELGDATALLELGEDYAAGWGVPKDTAESARWFLKAAELGDLDAEVAVGRAYASGDGLMKDYAEAARWFRKAAEMGKSSGEFYLAALYADGTGVPKDSAESLRLLTQAANEGNSQAQMALASDYWSGNAVPKDPANAYIWLSILLSGNVGSLGGERLRGPMQARESLANQMSSVEFAEAVGKFMAWRPTGEGSLLRPEPSSQSEANGSETYHTVTTADGLSCAYSQDLTLNLGGGFSGSLSAGQDHFNCTNHAGQKIAIELNSTAATKDGKVAIITKDFGVIFRGNKQGELDKYEMTENQIASLKKFLGF